MTAAPDRYAVIGHPIDHSRSPWIHARFAQQTGERIDYGAIDAAPEELVQRVRDFFAGAGREDGSRAPLHLQGSWDDPIVVAAD